MPGVAAQSDDEIDAFVRETCYVGMHPTSTCAMGMGADSLIASGIF